MVKYNNAEWDKTDKLEVDLVNKAIEVSDTPIHALDSTYDATTKLLNYIDTLDISIERDKHLAIIHGYENLLQRIKDLPGGTS